MQRRHFLAGLARLALPLPARAAYQTRDWASVLTADPGELPALAYGFHGTLIPPPGR